jgi:dienelactone hydrolase
VMFRRFGSYLLAVILAQLVFFTPSSFAQRIVDLTASDGTKLKASYFAASKPGPGVLLLHQCNRQRKVWDDLSQQLSAAGINVLTLDYRGFGESGGDPFGKLPPDKAAQVMDEGFPGDIDAAFQYLISQSGVTRDVIGIGGASCGVNNSIQAARRHPEVKSLVLLSGGTDLPGRQFLRQPQAHPVFFAVADNDEFQPTVQVVEWLYSVAANPGKQFAHYQTGGHGADMFKVHPELEKAIVDWYVTTLIKTPGRAPVPKDAPAVTQDARNLDLIDQPGGPAKVSKMLDDARQHDPHATIFPEAIANLLGYEHLQSGDTAGAIEILKLNVAAYPNSPNAYDSLSDAYLAANQKDLARQSIHRALDLLPSDTTDTQDFRDALKAADEAKLKQLSDAPK